MPGLNLEMHLIGIASASRVVRTLPSLTLLFWYVASMVQTSKISINWEPVRNVNSGAHFQISPVA